MNDLGFWMAMFTLGALAYYETPLGRLIRSAVRSLWARGQDLLVPAEQPRDRLGRWQSPGPRVTAHGNDQQPPLPIVPSEVTAVGRDVTKGNDVTSEVTIDEAVYITAHLVQGVAPSRVAKQLPGYTPKRYQDFATKVERVKGILADVGTDEG